MVNSYIHSISQLRFTTRPCHWWSSECSPDPRCAGCQGASSPRSWDLRENANHHEKMIKLVGDGWDLNRFKLASQEVHMATFTASRGPLISPATCGDPARWDLRCQRTKTSAEPNVMPNLSKLRRDFLKKKLSLFSTPSRRCDTSIYYSVWGLLGRVW